MSFVETLDARRLMSVTVETAMMQLVNPDGTTMTAGNLPPRGQVYTGQWTNRITASVANPDGDTSASVKLEYIDTAGNPIATIYEGTASVSAAVGGQSVLTFDVNRSFNDIQFPNNGPTIYLMRLTVDGTSRVLGQDLPEMTTLPNGTTIYQFADGSTISYDPTADAFTSTAAESDEDAVATARPLNGSPLKASRASDGSANTKKLKVFLSTDATLSKDDVAAGKYTGSVDDIKAPKKLTTGTYQVILAKNKKDTGATVLEDVVVVPQKPSATSFSGTPIDKDDELFA